MRITPVVLLPFLLAADRPETLQEPVTDSYHGVEVVDPYRWLEDWQQPSVKEWSQAQNEYARTVLDELPGTDILRRELEKILAATTVSHGAITVRPGAVFAIKRQPPKEQPFLVVMPSLDQPDKARILVDPSTIDQEGTTAIDFFVPSPDGKIVAVSLSKGGSESGDVHLYNVETGEKLDEVIPRVNGGTAGGDLDWTSDGKGFYYTRYPRGGERPTEDQDFYQQLYYHRLGVPTDEDRYEIGEDFPRIAEIRAEVEPETDRVLVTVQDGDSGRFAHYLRDAEGQWRQFSKFGDGIVQAAFGPDGIYIVTRAGSPTGKIVRISADDLDLTKAKLIVGPGEDSIVTDFYGYFGDATVIPTTTRLYVLYQLGGPSEIRAFNLQGGEVAQPKQLPVSSVGGLTRAGEDDLIFSNGSFVSSTDLYRFDAESGETIQLPLTEPLPVDFSDIEVVREFATSKDGTEIPVSILIPKGVERDGSNPCLVTGYGGYGISITPRFSPQYRVLFDRGFVIAIANLRGGSEYGEEWHRAGNLTNKQNVFDDFAAVLRHMIAEKYTNPDRLGIMGGSNGGLLMGATMTQHPDLMGAVVSFVGIYDMLRVELSPNGAFNIPEFGTVTDPDQFKALYAYSPYHHVEEGVDYPPVLFLTGENDPRVDPMQSRKMTARLQAAGAETVLLRTSASAGHGGDTSLSERIEEYVDVFAFLCQHLEVPVRE